MLTNIFAGGSTQQELMDTLNRVAPECPECRGKQLHFCIERECEGSQPFCIICQPHLHFLHRKNELRMLFVDRAYVSLTSREAFDRAERLTTLIAAQKKRSEQLVQNQIELLRSYSQVLNELERLKLHLSSTDHLTTMYNIVKEGVLGQIHNFKEARATFTQAFKELRLDSRNWELRNLSSVGELMRMLSSYSDNPLNIAEAPNRTIADCVNSLINEKSTQTTVQTMIRETNIERFISELDPPIYWAAADYNYRSRRCKVGEQQKCKGSRLVVEIDSAIPNVGCDIVVKNTLRQLTITSELINVVRFPQQLQKLVVVMMPANITAITQRLPPTLKILKATVLSTYWSLRSPYALKNMGGLRYLVLRDFGMKPAEVKEIVQFGEQRQLRVLALLKDESKVNVSQSRIRESRPEAVFTHIYPKLEPHYLVYKRKLLQVHRILRSKWIQSSKHVEDILEATMGRMEHAWQRNEALESILSRRTSLEKDLPASPTEEIH